MALGARKRLLALETRFVALEQRSFAAPAAQPAAQPAGARPETTPAPATPPAEKPAPTEPAPAEPAAETPEAASATPDDAVKPADTGTAATRPADAAHAAPANSPAAASPAGPPAGPGFEERLGTRWVVWVGGLALALGAIFLVRYSIEQGLIGPGLRIAFGALFAAALVAGGERARRKEALSGIAGLPQASIPAILTAAGTTAAYATVWAAHGLYGFVGPAFAFVLLGAVALATLGAALLHGPALAGLGLVGAYVTPMLVSSNESNFWALYLYLAVVTAAAYALARARLWRWLAIT
ncbi:MAG: DUF2339 domain-containing protein, partial [Rhizobiales bacterium]|nr:DUF2339 domain-containing protein [Hyphomicrobiales bacterium]